MKENVGDLEDQVIREGFSGRMRKYLTDVAQGVSGKRRLLVRFQDWCEKDLNLNKLTVVTLDRIPMKK